MKIFIKAPGHADGILFDTDLARNHWKATRPNVLMELWVCHLGSPIKSEHLYLSSLGKYYIVVFYGDVHHGTIIDNTEAAKWITLNDLPIPEDLKGLVSFE